MSDAQYVVFVLDTEEYGVEISFAQEVIRIPKQIRKLPNAPAFVDGIINLRDRVVPVVDLKRKLTLEQSERGSDSRLLVLNLEDIPVGIIVDDVAEVLRIKEQSIEVLDPGLSYMGGNSVSGIAKLDQRMILLLDALKLKTELI